MEIIYLLIFISVMIASGFLIAFVWSVNSGQYDDDVTPAIRMLFDNEIKSTESKGQENKTPQQ